MKRGERHAELRSTEQYLQRQILPLLSILEMKTYSVPSSFGVVVQVDWSCWLLLNTRAKWQYSPRRAQV